MSAGEIHGVGPGRATVTATAPWGKTASADVYVTADLLVASNRSGAFGLYQLRSESPDTLLPLLVDGGGNIQGVRSPDRTRIAFSSSRNGNFQIYIMNADGTDVRQLTKQPLRDMRPAWSPDGKRIAFTSARDGNLDIYVIHADGTNLRRITSDPDRDDFPVWHPDGGRLLIVSERSGDSDLYLVDVDEPK